MVLSNHTGGYTMIYLDYAASSPPFPQVIEKMDATAREHFGNPGALHIAGAGARAILQDSRRQIAQSLRVRPEEVYFTSGGTESNNWAVQAGCTPGRHHIVCSAAEHSSVLEAVRRMQRRGYEVTWLNPDPDGRISPDTAEAALHPGTALLCVQAVNNETGVLQDVDALAQAARSHNVPYFCDGVQSFGHVSQDLHKADLISLSAHKLGGPRGIGCLVVRQPRQMLPMILGGGQEFGLRSGTENLPAIAGFSLAAELICQQLSQEQQRIQDLRALLEKGLRSICPEIQIAGENACRSGITFSRFPGISAEEMVMRLDLKGICVSPGAACAARNAGPSHVLLSMGYSPKEAAEFVRFSPGRETTVGEIHETLAAIGEICRKRF